ncbi:MAG: cytochrome c biogenesis protein CcsA, partial [Candidatus Dadabacteria bacterium]|nr:cytochrome c biogenesis protein CcsA [Candidatus Dadabacteria bacterium]
MAETGYISVLVAFVLSIYVVFASVYGAKSGRRDFTDSARNAALAIFFLLLIATLALLHSLVNLDFSLKYVAMNTSTDLPVVFRLTSLWAGQAGSLLLWALVLSTYTALVVMQTRGKSRELMPYVIATLGAIAIFFTFIVAFVESPFERLPVAPLEGRGLNPILQNAYMAIHPVTLYLGYVGVAVPFAFGMGALLSGRLGDEWIRYSRKWTLFAWTFLSIGLILGARWAYLELGWGGYWAWDPVENAAFMPWLAATAFVHSVMIQERKGMLKKWNMSLIILTFFLSIFGTFITRSGVISSVHSFAQSDIGPLFLGFIAFILLFSFSMFLYRIKDLESENRFDSILSRESAFIFNNLLFLGAAFAVFLGTIFPIMSEAITGEKILVGPPYFNKVNSPIALALVLLMGVGPLISWRKASRENLFKNFFVPSVIAIVTGVLLFALGVGDVYALLAYSLSAFVLM